MSQQNRMVVVLVDRKELSLNVLVFLLAANISPANPEQSASVGQNNQAPQGQQQELQQLQQMRDQAFQLQEEAQQSQQNAYQKLEQAVQQQQSATQKLEEANQQQQTAAQMQTQQAGVQPAQQQQPGAQPTPQQLQASAQAQPEVSQTQQMLQQQSSAQQISQQALQQQETAQQQQQQALQQQQAQQHQVQQQQLQQQEALAGQQGAQPPQQPNQGASPQQQQQAAQQQALTTECGSGSTDPLTGIKEYTATASTGINAKLREGQSANKVAPGVLKGVQERLQTMNEPLVRHEQFLSFQEDENDKSRVTFPEFTSTSTDQQGGGGFGGAPGGYNLHFRAGMKGAPVDDISSNPGENEVILPPQKKCKILKRETNQMGGEDIELEEDEE
ncbi:hypothetical protein HK097_007992 [Rhizophlyctis rosea]|uniref:ADP ribosyltransferase domain-containing protein n=1 Tax=Rhizophlyctis rosea TaxID=64517 RepID=A0AAD5SAX6_9FUNG|nr:hypothetical protein HK097_007992 [Rhizophlyctis rosea]